MALCVELQPAAQPWAAADALDAALHSLCVDAATFHGAKAPRPAALLLAARALVRRARAPAPLADHGEPLRSGDAHSAVAHLCDCAGARCCFVWRRADGAASPRSQAVDALVAAGRARAAAARSSLTVCCFGSGLLFSEASFVCRLLQLPPAGAEPLDELRVVLLDRSYKEWLARVAAALPAPAERACGVAQWRSQRAHNLPPAFAAPRALWYRCPLSGSDTASVAELGSPAAPAVAATTAAAAAAEEGAPGSEDARELRSTAAVLFTNDALAEFVAVVAHAGSRCGTRVRVLVVPDARAYAAALSGTAAGGQCWRPDLVAALDVSESELADVRRVASLCAPAASASATAAAAWSAVAFVRPSALAVLMDAAGADVLREAAPYAAVAQPVT